MPDKILYWLRQDLRLSDNPALHYAATQGNVLPLYIYDNDAIGAASKVWLHHTLKALHLQYQEKLQLQKGNALKILQHLIKKHAITEVVWNRCYEPNDIQRDKQIKSALKNAGIKITTFNASLLFEPWEIEKKTGGNYRVFTPFYQRGCLEHIPPRNPILKPRQLLLVNDTSDSLRLEQLKLLPKKPWHKHIIRHWQVGEMAAKKHLDNFIKKKLSNYPLGRDYPADTATSQLSPYLHWGEISPNQIWYAIKKQPNNDNAEKFLRQLAWREFSYSLLFYYPDLHCANLQKKFDQFPWQKNKKHLAAWQQGKTGYPIIDAGMRELYQTGYMHNRVRMIVASFLVKNLMIHWREGAAWFWDCLFDADLANNSAGWQWVAGSGADAAPFFRVFNPTTQAKKWDKDGNYIRQYIPEIAALPSKHLFTPWLAPEEILKDANIQLGKDYPRPIVDLARSRQKALAAYQSIK
jgi:deoxyribodipyrimidine photo-lyase